MTIAALMTQPVTILTAASSTGRYGDEELDWGSATSVDTVAWIAQESRSENLDGRDAELSHWIGYFPAATVITARDRVVRDEITFEVDGPPNPARTPAGLHHIEANLRIVAG